MNLRLAASLLVVGSLASACGPQPRSSSATEGALVSQQGLALASLAGSAVRPTNTVEKRVASKSSTLAARFAVAVDGQDVRFNLEIVNTGAKRVEVTFPNGQAYDFVVVDSVGREVWSWADGRIFTQSVQNKLLAKGDAIQVTEKWSPARPGKFTAIARLKSTNFPIEERVLFEHK